MKPSALLLRGLPAPSTIAWAAGSRRTLLADVADERVGRLPFGPDGVCREGLTGEERTLAFALTAQDSVEVILAG